MRLAVKNISEMTLCQVRHNTLTGSTQSVDCSHIYQCFHYLGQLLSMHCEIPRLFTAYLVHLPMLWLLTCVLRHL